MLKVRQRLKNDEIPFRLPILKSMYHKSRTVTHNVEVALHGGPNTAAGHVLLPRSLLWALLFGWWLALVSFVVGGIRYVVSAGGCDYATLICGIEWYISGCLASISMGELWFRPVETMRIPW